MLTRRLGSLWAGQNEQLRIALGRPPIAQLGRGVRVLAMDGGGMKVRCVLPFRVWRPRMG